VPNQALLRHQVADATAVRRGNPPPPRRRKAAGPMRFSATCWCGSRASGRAGGRRSPPQPISAGGRASPAHSPVPRPPPSPVRPPHDLTGHGPGAAGRRVPAAARGRRVAGLPDGGGHEAQDFAATRCWMFLGIFAKAPTRVPKEARLCEESPWPAPCSGAAPPPLAYYTSWVPLGTSPPAVGPSGPGCVACTSPNRGLKSHSNQCSPLVSKVQQVIRDLWNPEVGP
jgi:hypothetical protein